MKFKFLENTADLSVRVYGKDISEIIKNSIFATASTIHSLNGLSENSEFSGSYQFHSLEEMLVKVLNDVVFEFDVNAALYFRCTWLDLGEGTLSIKISGHRFRRRPSARNLIKSVTYHNLSLKPETGQIDITFDL